MSVSMRKRKDNQLSLEEGAARTIEHTKEELDCSRSSIYELVRTRKLELVYLNPENQKLPRITTKSIRKLLGE